MPFYLNTKQNFCVFQFNENKYIQETDLFCCPIVRTKSVYCSEYEYLNCIQIVHRQFGYIVSKYCTQYTLYHICTQEFTRQLTLKYTQIDFIFENRFTMQMNVYGRVTL